MEACEQNISRTAWIADCVEGVDELINFLVKFSKSMTELSPFSIFLILSHCKLVNKISQEPLELGS